MSATGSEGVDANGGAVATVSGVEPLAIEAATTVGVAVSVPQPWAEILDSVRASSGDPLAPFIPAHLTVVGPTEVDIDRIAEVEARLADVSARHAPFTVHLRGTGTFRPVTEVVFVAVAAGISECERLALDVRSGPLMRELHYPYHPHITVAHDVPTEALDRVYAELADFEAAFTADHFTLYVHGADGHWRPLRDYKLTGVPIQGAEVPTSDGAATDDRVATEDGAASADGSAVEPPKGSDGVTAPPTP